jgi:hypothetical protein
MLNAATDRQIMEQLDGHPGYIDHDLVTVSVILGLCITSLNAQLISDRKCGPSSDCHPPHADTEVDETCVTQT